MKSSRLHVVVNHEILKKSIPLTTSLIMSRSSCELAVASVLCICVGPKFRLKIIGILIYQYYSHTCVRTFQYQAYSGGMKNRKMMPGERNGGRGNIEKG